MKYWYRMKIVETVESECYVVSDKKQTAKQLEKTAEKMRVGGRVVVTGVKDVDIFCDAAGEGDPPNE